MYKRFILNCNCLKSLCPSSISEVISKKTTRSLIESEKKNLWEDSLTLQSRTNNLCVL